MSLFDILGPVMVGPSSSHTAGAVKIGYVSRKLLGEKVSKARIGLSGSFYLTGAGHGTNIAIVAGLLGMEPDDIRIPNALNIAKEMGVAFEFYKAELREAHPNSCVLNLEGIKGRKIEIVGESIGGSLINIRSIDGLSANFSGDKVTLICHNQDQPGHVALVTGMLSKNKVNIAAMQLYRAYRGGDAVMVLECDQEIPEDALEWLKRLDGVDKVTYYSLLDGDINV